MGAEAFINKIQGTDARTCFDRLIEKANVQYGINGYNGSINTCDFGSCKKRYDKYSLANEKEALKLIQLWHNGRKWSADYIDLGVISYEVTTFKKELVKSTPKYKLSYAVNELHLFSITKMVKSFKTKTEADNYAIQLSKKNMDKSYVVTKEYVLIEGKKEVTNIIRDVKTYKSKPKLKDMPNRVVVPIRKYIFFGYASN